MLLAHVKTARGPFLLNFHSGIKNFLQLLVFLAFFTSKSDAPEVTGCAKQAVHIRYVTNLIWTKAFPLKLHLSNIPASITSCSYHYR